MALFHRRVDLLRPTLLIEGYVTGLIERSARSRRSRPVEGGFRIRIKTALAAELGDGESVCVNGVCLTTTLTGNGEMHADIGVETARITTLGSLRPGQPVNLERAMRGDGRFGGHFVQGHVDATAMVESISQEGTTRWIVIAYPPALASYLVPKGSIAVDGVSLTVARLEAERFHLMIIAFNWDHTSLSRVAKGRLVNLECDIVGSSRAGG